MLRKKDVWLVDKGRVACRRFHRYYDIMHYRVSQTKTHICVREEGIESKLHRSTLYVVYDIPINSLRRKKTTRVGLSFFPSLSYSILGRVRD